MIKKEYIEQVKLLLEVLPVIAKEELDKLFKGNGRV